MRARAADAVLRQHGHLVHWVPVCLALGIGLWFALPVEPPASAYAWLALAVASPVLLARRASEAAAPLLIAAALAGTGAGVAGLRAHVVAAPVLEFRYYGPVEGRIVGIDRSGSGAVRLTLDRVRLDDVAPARVPHRVRVSLHGAQGWLDPQPGLTVMMTAHLSPPGGAVEPGGFDFARHAWFERLGAVGYTRVPALMAAPPEGGARIALFRVRMALSAALQEALPGARGAFAAAMLTGDRSAIPPDALEDLRAANLAHLLAISGLHMGLLTGVVFGAVRGGIALVPPLALRVPGKKIAAIVALMVGAFYLALSGGNVATIRAFVMVAVMLVAVLLDRRAISLRSVAIAATIVLVLTPEALAGPGFQMSFAATVALVAAFNAVRRARATPLPRWVLSVGTVVLSSAVAGLATAPFAAAHFNRFTDYGLIANLLSVPLMGALVMPAAVATAVLAPVGLAAPAVWAMGAGLGWILAVAERVADLPGAITPVVAPGPLVLPLLSGGALVILLWQGRLRWVGAVPLIAAFLLWATTERPAVLISSSGGLVGVLGPEGRALSKPRGDAFSADIWLENDGDLATQEEAAARPAFLGPAGDRSVAVGGLTLRHVTGRGREERVAAACREADVVVINTVLDAAQKAAAQGSAPSEAANGARETCLLIDTGALRARGALALYLGGADAETRGARADDGIARTPIFRLPPRSSAPATPHLRLRHAGDRTAARLWHAR